MSRRGILLRRKFVGVTREKLWEKLKIENANSLFYRIGNISKLGQVENQPGNVTAEKDCDYEKQDQREIQL